MEKVEIGGIDRCCHDFDENLSIFGNGHWNIFDREFQWPLKNDAFHGFLSLHSEDII